MLNFAEQTGSGAVMLVWSFSLIQRKFEFMNSFSLTRDKRNKVTHIKPPTGKLPGRLRTKSNTDK